MSREEVRATAETLAALPGFERGRSWCYACSRYAVVTLAVSAGADSG